MSSFTSAGPSTPLPAKKRKYTVLSIEDKVAVLRRISAGENVALVAAEYGISSSAIYDLKKQKDALLEFYTQTIDNKQRMKQKTPKDSKFAMLEKCLYEWYMKKQNQGIHISGRNLITMAMEFYRELRLEEPCEFSTVWLADFKKRHGIVQSVASDKMHVDAGAKGVSTSMIVESSLVTPALAQDDYKPKLLQLQHNHHFRKIMEALASDEAFVDVTLTAEGRTIRAHKLVVSAMSPYFQQLLCNNPCPHPVIIMPHHVQFDHLSHIVNYMYKGEITVAEDQVKSLLETAELLQVHGLALSDPVALITDKCTDTVTTQSAFFSEMASHLTHSTGGIDPLDNASQVTIQQNSSQEVVKLPACSSVALSSPTSHCENTNTYYSGEKMPDNNLCSSAVECQAVCGSGTTAYTRVNYTAVRTNKPSLRESSTGDNTLQDTFFDDIDIVKEEVDLLHRRQCCMQDSHHASPSFEVSSQERFT
nr:uncharacterized protein LOC123774419 [Procambarus clarkii]